jgi:DNA-binding transcriptional MerR regulator
MTVRLSELSRQSELPIPTIKFYLREGLLPTGDSTDVGRAEYTAAHLRRLRLIRALAQVGDLALSTIAEVLATIDDDDVTVHDALGSAHYALAARGARNVGSAELDEAREEVDAFLDGLGWTLKPDAPDRDELASALVTLRSLGWKTDARAFMRYAKAADRLARWEIAQMPEGVERETAVENAVVGTVVFESVLSALRRLAEEHHSAARFASV